MPGYEIVRVESWEDYLRVISNPPYSDWAFRGQREGKWRMYSGLSRYLYDLRVDPKMWIDQEERILRIFKRKAHNFLSRLPGQEDDFEWLALMQHHGAPTRLLDFTWSPYVAAFFALERAAGDAAVWAINPAQVGAMQGQLPLFSADSDPTRQFRRFFLRQEVSFVWVGEPQAMNRRLTAQSGTFAIPGNLNQPLEEILSGYPDPGNALVKFILPAGQIRKRGLRELYRMKITRESLFPDLDGLARSLAYELEFHWAYDPHSGAQ